ncbi:unnamed protein product [Staurois parvus]|uniref:Uncharacterized protein n=1 Tax=Staurois parvus TaxID=386267 RepID=A0ABN9DZC4_9NEOB|nr:unnamed protein product [Staurois parvus]
MTQGPHDPLLPECPMSCQSAPVHCESEHPEPYSTDHYSTSHQINSHQWSSAN